MAGTASHTTGESHVPIETDDTTAGEDRFDEDDAFEVLSNPRRRYALQYLFTVADDGTEWPTLRELARQVAARETATPAAEVAAEDRRRVQIAFHQTHLPALEDHGLITYDETTKTITLTDRAPAVRPYLNIDTATPPWSGVYIGIGAMGLLVATVLWMDITPIAAVAGAAWLGGFAALLITVGILHAGQTTRFGSG